MAESVNINSIMKKVKQYTKTPEGKLRMQETIDEAKRTGQEIEGLRIQTGNGHLTSEDEMRILTNIMMNIIDKHLPESIKDTGDGLYSTDILWRSNKRYRKMAIYFREEDIYRPSLMWEDYGDGPEWTESRPWQSNYPNGGIDNIVALLNNGAHSSNYVYGYWHGHPPYKKRPGDRSLPDAAYVRSKKDREPLRFMQDAVQEFNRLYGWKYHVIAYCGEDYGGGETSGLMGDSVLLQS